MVGGGVTGLAFANFTLAEPEEWLVLERDAEPGGYCKTVRQDGFVWDYSGHFFHFRHKDIERYLTERMPPNEEVLTVAKSSGILFKGVRVDFPFQKNIHQLPREDFIDCLHDLYFKDADREIASFADMLYARFGKGIAERFLIPYNEKLYACSMDRLDADAMGRFFPHADTAAIIRNFKTPDNTSYNATFTYPRGGAFQYVRALLRDLPERRIATSEELVRVDPKRRVATTSRREIRYEHMVSSMPFNQLLSAAGVDHESALYSWNKVLVFNLGFDRKGQARDHWLYVPERDYCFYRVGFYDNIFQTERMSLYVEIGLRAEETGVEPEAWLERVLADLERIGITDGHSLVSWHSIVLNPAYVHIHERSRRDFERRSAALAEQGIHTAGRYGGWTYCSIEDNILEARALARELG